MTARPQLTLLVGGWIMVLTKAPLLIVVLLVVVKTGADLHAHQVEHSETDTGVARQARG